MLLLMLLSLLTVVMISWLRILYILNLNYIRILNGKVVVNITRMVLFAEYVCVCSCADFIEGVSPKISTKCLCFCACFIEMGLTQKLCKNRLTLIIILYSYKYFFFLKIRMIYHKKKMIYVNYAD